MQSDEVITSLTDECTWLWRTSQQTGFCYKSTAIDWANFVCDLFRQYSKDVVFSLKSSCDIEVDESRFGRCSKMSADQSSVQC